MCFGHRNSPTATAHRRRSTPSTAAQGRRNQWGRHQYRQQRHRHGGCSWGLFGWVAWFYNHRQCNFCESKKLSLQAFDSPMTTSALQRKDVRLPCLCNTSPAATVYIAVFL